MKKIIKYFLKLINFLNIEKKIVFFFLFSFLLLSFIETIGFGFIGSFVSLAIKEKVVFLDNNIISGKDNLINYFYINNSVKSLGIILLTIFFIKFLIYIFLNKKINFFIAKSLNLLRSKIVFNILNYNYDSYNSKSELVNSLIRHANITINNFLYYFIKSFSEILTILFLIIFLFFLEWQVTITVILLLFILFIFYKKYISKSVLFFATRLGESNEFYIDWLYSLSTGLKEIKIYNKQSYFQKKITDESYNISKYEKKFKDIQIYPRVLIEFFFIILILIFSLLIYYVFSLNYLVIGKFSIFFLVIIRILPVYNQLINQLNELNFSLFSVDYILQKISDNKYLELKNTKKINLVKKFTKVITFKDINFSYNKKNLILKNFSQNIKFNKITGIIGSSGSGKSTMINLLLGFLKPDSGNILIDGYNLKDITVHWQNKIAYIPQSIFLTNSTIKENITLEEEKDIRFDQKKFSESLRISGLSSKKFKSSFNINYKIKDHGINLSGGEKQRISIARGFYHQRDIIIMDEPTSSLDSNSKIEFYEYILGLKYKFTIILVSHDEAVQKICDDVILIK